MGKHIHNETLDQQRRAQRELIELKKMQAGELKPEPKPSEESVLPKTFGEKVKNFWFYYRWHTLAVILSAAVLAVMITQCVGREKYDSRIVLFTYDVYTDTHTEAMSDYFEKLCTDRDGNGEIKAGVFSCSYTKETGDVQYRNSMATKLQSILMAERDISLFILDEETYEYLNDISDDSSLFIDNPVMLGEDFYAACDVVEGLELPRGLMVACRYYDSEVLEKSKDVASAYDESLRIIDRLRISE